MAQEVRQPELAFDLINLLPTAFLTINAHGYITFSNRAFERLTGLETAHILGQPAPTVIQEIAGGSWQDFSAKVKAKGKPEASVLVNAAEGPLMLDVIAYWLDAGHGEGCCLLELHKVDPRQKEKLLTLIFNGTNNYMCLVSVEGPRQFKIVSVNDAYLEINQKMGITASREAIEGKWLDEYLRQDPQQPEHEVNFIIDTYQEAVEKKESVHFEERTTFPNGEMIFSDSCATPLIGSNGAVKYLLYITHDITARKQAEGKLKKMLVELKVSERRARMADFAVENSPDAITLFDLDLCYKKVNEAACRMSGYTRDEMLNMRVADLNTELHKMDRSDARSKLLAGQWITVVANHRRKDGSTFPLESNIALFEFEKEKYYVTFSRDITERLAREKALQEALGEVQTLKQQLEQENIYLREEIHLNHNFNEIISNSKKFRQVLKLIEQVASTDTTVLLLGETGTGKELLARAVHNISTRNARSLVKVNCAALPANLIESELFGHEKGAFTGATSARAGRFELANKGSIFLDEIGELPLELQSKLLRVLQEGEFERLGGTKTIKVDVRVIAATNRDLEKEVEKGNFRADLFFRLNVFPVDIPPLRERKEDIEWLVQYFAQRYSKKMGRHIDTIPRKTLDKLLNYHWPGNIRELENVIERAVVLSSGTKLEIGNWFVHPATPKKQTGPEAFQTLEAYEKAYITRVLAHTGWRVSGPRGAAMILGMNDRTLQSRMKKLGISRPV